MEKKGSPLGTSDFKKIIEANRYFVDKTMLIRHVLKGDDIILLCRPRRFGKSLNMEMLRCFFAKGEDNRHLFDGLKISQDAESMTHLGKYPAILVSFKDAKQNNFDDTFFNLCYSILQAWKSHQYLAKNPETEQEYKEWIDKLNLDKKNKQYYVKSLHKLSELLFQYHQEQVVLLIDEYDAPVHAGWLHGYYDDIVSFLKTLLGSAMKENKNLKKGVLTGILRVAKESMFSDLNNFISSTVLDSDPYSDQFGFTEEEVADIFRYYDMNGSETNSLHEWYDGYRYGRHRIYNPWSVLNYVFSLEHDLKPFWVNTSQDQLLRRLMFNHQSGITNFMEPLLRGEKFVIQLGEHLVFKDLLIQKKATWTMLVMAGYLKAEKTDKLDHYTVSIPNKEVRYAFTESIASWMESDMRTDTRQQMLEALTLGNIKDFEYYLSAFVLRVFSYFDTSSRYVENFYHAFFLGLFAGMEDNYDIRSNREDGYGRYDICLTPHDRSQKGIIIEVKTPEKATKETLAAALEVAKQQILENRYETGLKTAGVSTVLRLAIAVQGKKVKVAKV